MGFMADIPPFECWLRREFLYDLKKGQGRYERVRVFAVDSIEGRAIGFDCLTDWGGMFARLPIHAFCHVRGAARRALSELELWDCFAYRIEAHPYAALQGLTCDVRLGGGWERGEYMFTLSWFGSTPAEAAGDSGFKRAHIVQLEDGNYAAQPNNRIRWHEAAFIVRPFPERPDFRTNSHIWVSERGKRTEATDRYYYEVEKGRRK